MTHHVDGSAYMSGARAAAVRLRALERQISGLLAEAAGRYPGQDPSAPHVRSSGLSDPTWQGALSVRAHARRLDWLRRERDSCMATTDEFSEVVSGMRRALGDGTADAVRMYYLDRAADGVTWPEVADALGVTERTVLRRRSVAADWLSDVGIAHAKAGDLTRGHQDK